MTSTNPTDSVDEEVTFKTSFSNPIYDCSFGLCIGASIGDSIGSYCEFKRDEISPEILDIAMSMPGGGTWGSRVCGGQVTDDTEIAISLAYGLIAIVGKTPEMQRIQAYENAIKHHQNMLAKNIFTTKKTTTDDSKVQSNQNINNTNTNTNNSTSKNKTNHIFDLLEIAKEYKRWLRSSPFDIGFCTRRTFGSAPKVNKMRIAAFDFNAAAATKYKSDGNLTNGSMMRCMPLIVYGHKLSNAALYKLMTADSKLSHANDIIYVVTTAYAIIAKYLICYSGDKTRNRTAFWKALEWLRKCCSETTNNSSSMNKAKDGDTDNCPSAKAAEEVFSWVKWIYVSGKANKNKVLVSAVLDNMQIATKQIGYVKIAFQRACYHLYMGHSFEFAIRDTVREAGDSDTNACIVGGLMGAYHGLDGIPKYLKEKIIHCAPKGVVRDLFQAKWYFKDKIIQHLIEQGPNDDSEFVLREEYDV